MISTCGSFDAVMDFDRLLAEPARPMRLLPTFDCGDRLHPGNAGNKAMADAIDLDTILGDAP
ncbi:hypothetical protein [Aureimonas sp. AU40]|uniref:hypothetical protein n=1 Tax=Aureimonas sp. AU40 TaxID=1637747 RepID=UPI000782453A|nr:hypothetical protein [Aureimonas sp. AU40]